MYGLAVYVKEGLPFAQDLPLGNSADSYLCFRLALLDSVFYFFFLYQSPSASSCMVFDSISFNIDGVLSINPSANVVFRDFNVHHKNWLTYSAGKDQPGELGYNFSISNDLTQMVYFLTQIQNCDSHSSDYSHADWDGFGDHFRDVPWEDIFKLGASAAANEICKWVSVGIDVNIPHKKYHVKPQSSPFSCLCSCHSSEKSLFPSVPKG